MNKKEKFIYTLKGGFYGVISCVLAMTTVSVVAKTASEKIDVTYRNIKIYADGNLVDTTDNEAFIYNGTTYLPVRAVGEAFNKSIDWDGQNSAVYIGKNFNKDGNSNFLLEPYECDNYRFEMFNNGESFVSAGEKRTNGFTMDGYNWVESYALFNLNGEYNTMSFNLGHVDGTEMKEATIKIYLDGRIVKEIEMNADDLPKKFTIPLNGALQMKITKSGSYSRSQYGFFDVALN